MHSVNSVLCARYHKNLQLQYLVQVLLLQVLLFLFNRGTRRPFCRLVSGLHLTLWTGITMAGAFFWHTVTINGHNAPPNDTALIDLVVPHVGVLGNLANVLFFFSVFVLVDLARVCPMCDFIPVGDTKARFFSSVSQSLCPTYQYCNRTIAGYRGRGMGNWDQRQT